MLMSSPFENSKNIIVDHINRNYLSSRAYMIYFSIDSSVPNSQFRLAGYTIFRYDGNSCGGGIFMYVNDSSEFCTKMIMKLFYTDKPSFEIILPDNSKSVVFESLFKSICIYLDTCKNVISLGHFNMNPEGKNVQLFVVSFNLEHLIKKPTCSNGSLSCINLIIRKRKSNFRKTCLLKTVIS